MAYVNHRSDLDRLKSAIAGREGEILFALGIDGRATGGHIRCPYPDHEDRNPSWRWDNDNRRAHCTCIQGGDDVFDVIRKVRGCSFAEALSFAAERVGYRMKQNQLKAQYAGPSNRVEKLLSPQGDHRDDTLVGLYLGERLNVDPDDVPMPTTRVAGWRALDYFDPSDRHDRSSRQSPVASPPAIVFETTDLNGSNHAHRIYLSPDGTRKADLGAAPNGSPRPAKKSAPTQKSRSVAGCAVYWGDPTTGNQLVLCEGIETGAAIALAFQAQIIAGEIAIVAALSATGIAAYRPPESVSRITIAADRDEAPKPDGQDGSRAGEKAARTFARKNNSPGEMRLALPGPEKENCDWLDIFVSDGAAHVREEILSAPMLIDTDPPFCPRESLKGNTCDLGFIRSTFPLPQVHGVKVCYQHSPDGEIWLHKAVKSRRESSDFSDLMAPVASPFSVTSRLLLAGQNDAFGLRLSIFDMNGSVRMVDIQRGALAKSSATDVLRLLFDAGLRVQNDGEKLIVNILKSANPNQQTIIVDRPGWFEIPAAGERTFITPGGAVIGETGSLQIDLSDAVRLRPDVASRGTKEGWRRAIDAALDQPNTPHWAVAILGSFVGPIIDLLGMDSCGIHFSGLSSAGKSTGQQLAVSAWSAPGLSDKGLFQSARATTNATELVAELAHGTVLAIDELAHLDSKETATLIYMLSGGSGKRRMTADITLRDNRNWKTFAILSGEIGLDEKIRIGGSQMTTGMTVRVIDIDVSDVNRMVDRENLSLIELTRQNYGHAGPAFVEGLIRHGYVAAPETLRSLIREAEKEIVKDHAADSAIRRAALVFALLKVAGKLAIEFGILPTSPALDNAIHWAWAKFCNSPEGDKLDPVEVSIERLKGLVTTEWNIGVREIGDHVSHQRAPIGWHDDDTVYLTKSAVENCVGGLIKIREVGRALHERGLLAKKSKSDRYTLNYVPGCGPVVVYGLARSEFGPNLPGSTPRHEVDYGGEVPF